MSDWQPLLILLAIGAVIFLFGPRLKQRLQDSKQAEANWSAVVLPLGALIGFVLLLIYLSRN